MVGCSTSRGFPSVRHDEAGHRFGFTSSTSQSTATSDGAAYGGNWILSNACTTHRPTGVPSYGEGRDTSFTWPFRPRVIFAVVFPQGPFAWPSSSVAAPHAAFTE